MTNALARVPRGQVCIAVDGVANAVIETLVREARSAHALSPGSRVVIQVHDDPTAPGSGSPYPRSFTLGPRGELIRI